MSSFPVGSFLSLHGLFALTFTSRLRLMRVVVVHLLLPLPSVEINGKANLGNL